MLLAPLILALACSQAPPKAVLIICDDLGKDALHLMPSVCELAGQGMVFNRAYSWPTCSPTRLATWFGQYPRRAGIGDLSLDAGQATGQDRLPLDLVAISKVIRPTDLIGKWHLGRAPLFGEMNQVPSGPFAHGVRHWLAGSPSAPNAGVGATGHYDWSEVNDGDLVNNFTVYTTDAQRDAFLGLYPMPRLCVLAWSAPHAPFDAPPGVTPAATNRGRYEQAVVYLDEAIDDCLKTVDLGTDFVVFMSDNGTPFDAAPVPGFDSYWKGSVFEGGINVPLIVAGPGITPGTSDRLVSAVDIPATLAELLDLAPGETWLDSESFADELGAWNGEPARAFVMSERYEVTAAPGAYPQPTGFDAIAIVEEETTWPGTSFRVRMKRVLADMDGNGPGGTTDVVFDLLSDPYELAPGQFSALPVSIKKRMNAELASLPVRK